MESLGSLSFPNLIFLNELDYYLINGSLYSELLGLFSLSLMDFLNILFFPSSFKLKLIVPIVLPNLLVIEASW